MIESRIQHNIIKKIMSLGGIAVKVDASVTGWPDLTVILPNGVVLFLEVKQPTGRLRPRQKVVIKQLEENNANVYVVHSPEEADAIVQRHLTQPTGGH